MSLADEAKLLLIPSGYKSGKVYSVFPTSGNGDFTFSLKYLPWKSIQKRQDHHYFHPKPP